MDLDPSTLETMSPDELVRLIRGMPEAELTRVLGGPDRQSVLDAVLTRLPELFRPEKAQGVRSTVQLRITGGPAEHPEDSYELVIADGRCSLSERPGSSPDAALSMGPVELARLISGRGNPAMMVLRGKIKVRGDLGHASRFSSYFAFPQD